MNEQALAISHKANDLVRDAGEITDAKTSAIIDCLAQLVEELAIIVSRIAPDQRP